MSHPPPSSSHSFLLLFGPPHCINKRDHSHPMHVKKDLRHFWEQKNEHSTSSSLSLFPYRKRRHHHMYVCVLPVEGSRRSSTISVAEAWTSLEFEHPITLLLFVVAVVVAVDVALSLSLSFLLPFLISSLVIQVWLLSVMHDSPRARRVSYDCAHTPVRNTCVIPTHNTLHLWKRCASYYEILPTPTNPKRK